MTNNIVISNEVDLEVWTEGKTDWKILKKAIEKRGSTLHIKLHEYDDNMGDTKLLQRCKTFAERENKHPLVFVFDHDKKDVVEQVMEPGKLFKGWGNNVYSLAIPIPDHRAGSESVSIEFYFPDNDLHLQDKDGRRLFLTSEFVEKSGKFASDPKISVGDNGVLKGRTNPTRAKIIDTEVYDATNSNIALSKSDFANFVRLETKPFDNLDFNAFDKILDIFGMIVSITRPLADVYFPNVEGVIKNLKGKDDNERFTTIARMVYDVTYLALEIFSIVTIRIYEDAIVNEPEQYRKKARPIKTILADKMTTPSIQNLLELSKSCYHIIDASAPLELQNMKLALEQAELLGSIGIFLDDLQRIFPPEFGTAMVVDKHKLSRSFLEFIAPHLAKFDEVVQLDLNDTLHNLDSKLNFDVWADALREIIKRLTPLVQLPLNLKIIESWDPRAENYVANIRLYKNGTISHNQVSINQHETEDIEPKTTDLILGNGSSIHLFPFLQIKDDALYFYKGFRAKGYIYASVLGQLEHLELTKKKFNHSVFKTGSKQELFWTDVLPTINSINGIKANIPDDEDLRNFVGRSRQKRLIKDEIFEIPNQNGIVYGPGGIGKTTLMLQLSRELYENPDKNDVLFENIIWISAKSDFYDYIYGAIEKRNPKFRSLDQILQALLEFFDLESLEEYGLDDKKYFTLEVLKENRVLLILDNFETVLADEVNRIIRFFDVDVKRELRKQPDYFKVIITSRKQIPCSFHQVELKGLDPKESKQLMSKISKRYKRAADQLTEAQQELLYEATKGIPIVIKHCFAKLYIYNNPFDYVISSISNYSGEIVQFSFQELLQEIETKDKDQIQLKILMLLELVNDPLMLRQIADILVLNQADVDKRIPTLLDYQCLSKISYENTEKYTINPEIRLLTRSLAQEHGGLATQIRKQINSNFSIDKQMDYNDTELRLIGMFDHYLRERNYLEAETFIKEQVKQYPESVILNYHYARYQKDRKRDVTEAIKLLESIREKSRNHPKVLLLLIESYISLEIPNFDKASIYASDLESLQGDEEIKIGLAEFYVRWSTSLKLKRGLDPFEEKSRQDRYKTLASKGLALLEDITTRTHQIYYLMAQSYFNLWDYDNALHLINNAIETAEKKGDYSQSSYYKFRDTISFKGRTYRNQTY